MIYLQYKLRRAGIEHPSRILLLCDLPKREVKDIVDEMTAIAPGADVTVGFPEDEIGKFDLAVIAYWHRIGVRSIIRDYIKVSRLQCGKIMLYERTARRAIIFDSQHALPRALSFCVERSLAKVLLMFSGRTSESL